MAKRKSPSQPEARRPADLSAGQRTYRAQGKRIVTHAVGALPILNRLLERLRLQEFLARHLPAEDDRTKVDTPRVVLLLLRNLLVSRAPVYRIKDTSRGPEVWEIQWHACWRKSRRASLDSCGLVSGQGTLIVARNVLTDEKKYFFSNRVPGRDGWTLRDLLYVAFGRWQVETCFREVKEELGWDHFECRGWRCIHRHLYVTILSALFCARVRQQLSPSQLVTSGELLTLEQVRRAANVYLDALDLPPKKRKQRYQQELDRQAYYQQRSAAAATSHRKTRLQRLHDLGIDPDQIKSVPPKHPPC